jgi:hypothetical protein
MVYTPTNESVNEPFQVTFKLLKREKENGKTKHYEKQPQTPYQHLLASPDIP